MNEFKTEKAVYTPEDFQLWESGKILDITPKFQRRAVWRTASKSYFIDTILRGMTVPPIYLRITQNDSKTKTIRQVVDGQQRIRSVLDFVNGTFRLSKTLSAAWAGKSFAQLSEDEQLEILHFGFSSEIFKGISDQQVLDVFCRLNMNGVPLNKQELRNGRFFGLFKQSSWKLALDYLEFWRRNKIFTEMAIARMLEVELTSELLIASLRGMQDGKTSMNDFYELWENEYPEQVKSDNRFNETMSVITETFPDNFLAGTEFRRAPMFYTLFCTVFHYMFGLPHIQRTSPKKKLKAPEREALQDAVVKLSEVIVQAKDPSGVTEQKYQAFLTASTRGTDNVKPRVTRLNTLYGTAF